MSHPATNHFELFGLSVAFELDTQSLGRRYHELARSSHPDRYASAPEPQKLRAVQLAAQVNEAFRILQDPISRARYILEMKGAVLNDESATLADPQFLMEQMELREALADARMAQDPLGKLAQVGSRIQVQMDQLIQTLCGQLETTDLAPAYDTWRRLQFFRRLQQEAETLTNEIEDELGG